MMAPTLLPELACARSGSTPNAVINPTTKTAELWGAVPKTSVLYVQKRHAREDAPEQFQNEPQTHAFMAVADTVRYVVKNNVEDYSPGIRNDLAAIAGAYVRGE